MRNLLVISCLLLFAGCGKKKVVTEIDPARVRETLLRYGESNPEKFVEIETEFGTMRIRLYEDTPLHRANFVKNIKDGVYEDATFYRIISKFMVQAGIYPDELDYTVPAEFNKKYIHKKGAVSMARGDENNPGLESSATEFFIVQGSRYLDYQVKQDEENFGLTLTPEQRNTYVERGGYMSLDQQYTTFGEVVEGLDIVDEIASVKVFDEDKPLRKIPLKSIRLVQP